MGPIFRASKTQNLVLIGVRTASYAAVLWVLTLGVFPGLIVWAENALGIERIEFPLQTPLAIVVFAISAVFNLHSALTMVQIGKGTPLPMDCAPILVVRGLYRYVRNPMAIGGLGMGFAVAIGYGSLSVFVYVVAGMVLWNYVVRPIEEQDLQSRFGEPYERYRQQVKCWVPTFSFRSEENDSGS